MEKRKQFTFYASFYDALERLPPEQAMQGAWAIVTYGLLGKLPDIPLEPAAEAVFIMAKPVMEAARSKADAVIASNQRRAKKKPSAQWDSNVVPITAQEKEKEKENEIENENEKESLLHMGSGEPVCVKNDFDLFWEQYPLKLAKKQAWAVWQRQLPATDAVMQGLACWKRSRKWTTEQGRYIPRADRFLEEKHYLDLPKGVVPMGASGWLGRAELEAIEELMRDESL